jgi:hypothetical protein
MERGSDGSRYGSHKSCGGGELAQVMQTVERDRIVGHKNLVVDAEWMQAIVLYARRYLPS